MNRTAMFTLSLSLLAPGVTACAREAPGADDDATPATTAWNSRTHAAPDSLCAGSDNSYECAQLVETRQLSTPRLARVAARTPDGLLLRMRTGDTLTLRNADTEDVTLRFSFRDYWEGPGWFVVHCQHWEGADYLLIHAGSGERLTLPERPVLSPDGSRIVAASAGLSGLSNGNVVRIVRLAPGGAVQELELRPADWEPSDPQWLDASTIQLRQQAPLTGETRAFSKSIEMVRIRGEWQLREKPVP